MTTIQVRHGAAAGNPVLAVGEPGYKTSTGEFKIGDGSTAFNSLPAFASVLTANASTTVGQVNTWLATPVMGGGVHRLQGALTINAPLVIPSNTYLDATGAVITPVPGTNKSLIQNAAVTPLRSTMGNAVVVAGDNTVTTATGAFTSADIGRVLQVAFLDEAGFGANVYGTITAINSGTSVEVTPAPLYTQTGGVARIYGRDKNIHIQGGLWDKGADGGGVADSSIRLRRIDGCSVKQLQCRSTDGKYAIAAGDVTDCLIEEISGDTDSDKVHFQGPGKNITVRNVRGASGDDMAAFTTTDYGEWNDCHGSFQNLLIEDIKGDPGTARMVLLAGSCLFQNGGSGPNLPDGHSYDGVTIRDVCNTGSATSAGIVTWVQCDDPNGRIDHLSITNATCNVRLFHNAHGKVTLENVTGDIKVASMPTGYPNTAAVTDDLTVTNCTTGVFDTNDTRSTITKLAIRGGSLPYLSLACHAVGSALMDRVKFLNRVFGIDNGCAVGVLTFNHCTGGADSSTAGVGRIEASASVGEVNFNACNLASATTTNAYLIHVLSGASLGTARVARSTMTGIRDILRNDGAAQVLLFLSDLSIVSCNRIAEGGGGAVVKYAGVAFDGGLEPFYTDGPMHLSGSAFSAPNASKDVLDGGGTVHVLDPNLRARVDTLAKALGDMAYNTNGGLACGSGPVISDGTHWKNLYTGAATP